MSRVAPRIRANPLALAVLACLYERPMHPYEVAQTLRSRAKHESIRLNYGSLYAVVDGLQARGLISALETVREGRRPERTIYELTDTGTRELVDWLSELVATPTKEYLQFVAALSFLPVLAPEDAVMLLTERTHALEMKLAQHRGMRRTADDMGLPRLFLLEEEYEAHLLETELDWVRLLVKDIEAGTLEGLDQWRSWSASDRHPFGQSEDPPKGST